MSESDWIHRAQTAEARLKTLEQQIEPVKIKVQHFKESWGIKESNQDGSYKINFDKFAENLGMEQALELRAIIDEKYGISGAPGEKPKVRMKAKEVAS